MFNAASWRARVEKLIMLNFWEEGLKLANEFYKGSGTAVVGLPTEASMRAELIGDFIRHKLIEYFEMEMAEFDSQKGKQSVNDDYKMVFDNLPLISSWVKSALVFAWTLKELI